MSVPYYDRHGVAVHAGDCLDVLRSMPDSSVDSIISDPPYGLEFMGKDWDRPWAVGLTGPGYSDGAARLTRPSFGDSRNANCRTCKGRQRGESRCACVAPDWDRHPREDMRAFQQWCEAWARECLRVLKPGGHLAAFGGTRTYHRLASGIEDAGFEIRDGLVWLYGSGFPKSLDVSKAIDKAAGAEREVIGTTTAGASSLQRVSRVAHSYRDNLTAVTPESLNVTAPATPAAQRWQGWGTALKPAHEPIVLARKPLSGTVAGNVLTHGTGALHIDACRTAMTPDDAASINSKHAGMDVASYERAAGSSLNLSTSPIPLRAAEAHAGGRWPANVLLDDVAAAELDAQSGTSTSRVAAPRSASGSGEGWRMTATGAEYDDRGGASRFFPTFKWEAKAPTDERPQVGGIAHPTVKPLGLMRWLVRLLTPPGGLVLDPFAGSGTTLQAARAEGFRAIGIEREPTYLPLIKARLDARPRQAEAAATVVDDEPMDLLDFLGDAS